MTLTDYEKRLQERMKKLEKDNEIAYMFNSLLIVITVIAVIVAVVSFNSAKLKGDFYKNQIKQYQFYVDDMKASKEWKAITKCKNEDYWKAECIAYELNERK